MLEKKKKTKKAKHNLIKEKIESKKYKLINAKRVEDAQKQINFVHRQNKDDNCYIAFGTKENPKKFEQWHIQYDVANDWNKLMNMLALKDLYMGLSSSYKCSRKLADIRHLNAFWVDLDYYNISKYKNKTAEEMIEILRKKSLFKDLEPSFFEDSGRGMYIIYLIKECPKQLLNLWQIIENKLCHRFVEFGADFKSTDAVHILRLSGTENTKTGRIARYIPNSDKLETIRYTISEIGDKLLPPLKYTKEEWLKLKEEKGKNKKKTKKNREVARVYTFYNLYSLHQKRMEDIEKLVELREGDCTGNRELLCFLYRYFSCCYYKDPHNALNAVQELNSKFNEPLSDNEVIKATKSAENAYELWEKTYSKYNELDEKVNIVQFFRNAGCYIYSNKKLIDLFKITAEEMQHLQTIIDTKEKNRRAKDYQKAWEKENREKRNEYRNEYRKNKRRNENGLTQREQGKLKKINKIKELMEQGLKQKEIAEMVGLDKSGVSRYIKEIKQEQVEKVAQNDIENTKLEINDLFERVTTTDIQALIC